MNENEIIWMKVNEWKDEPEHFAFQFLRVLVCVRWPRCRPPASSRRPSPGWLVPDDHPVSALKFPGKKTFIEKIDFCFCLLSLSNKSPVSALKFPEKKTFIEKKGFCQFCVCFCFPLFIYYEALKVICQLKNYLRTKLVFLNRKYRLG